MHKNLQKGGHLMLLSTLYKDIKTLVDSVVIKYNKYAKQYETVESIRNSDMYIDAIMKTDSFVGYDKFSIDAITAAGMDYPQHDIFAYAEDKYMIPLQYRDKVMEEQRKIIINTYVELNNYYRMLNGQPDLEESETDFIKLSDEDAAKYGILDNSLYIHQYSDDDIYKLEEYGYISELIQKYPTKKYLSYLGTNKIPIQRARQANNFSIIRISKNVPEDFYSQFLTIYEQNREYFSTVIYIQDYSSQYDLYDNFIALAIMIMTIQRNVSNAFKQGIQRNFYDWEFIRNMYKMYNIPFVENVPIEYHVALMKNFNNLLRYKSTDKVLFDICSLLGYERMKLYRYYLVKEHKLDQDGKPLFLYKHQTDDNGDPMYDDDGNPVYIEDIERMYELYFQAVNIQERNIALALTDTSNKLSYVEVTSNDPYWWEDNDLKKARYENVYNYIETKYLSLNLMYKMTEMLFEITYAFRMIIDKKEQIDNILIDLPKIYAEKSFKLFDIIVFMVALLCKSNGFGGGVITSPSKISHIYGFNFNDTQVDIIRKMIIDNANKLEIDPSTNQPVLLKYFKDLSITTPSNVNDLYVNIHAFNDYIVQKMYECTDIDEYRVYKDIFHISMVSQTQTEMFTISKILDDGSVESKPAETYAEYLEYNEPILHTILQTTETGDVNNVLEHVLANIESFMESLQYLYIVNDQNSPLFTSISTLLKFFKSYTVDITSYNIIYVFDSKYYNMIKLIEDIKMVSSNIDTIDKYKYEFSDHIKTVSAKIPKNDLFIPEDKYTQFIRVYLNDGYGNESLINLLTDEMIAITMNAEGVDELNVNDRITNLIKSMSLQTRYKLLDEVITKVYDKYYDKLIDRDDIDYIQTYILGGSKIKTEDMITGVITAVITEDDIHIREDNLLYLLNITHSEILNNCDMTTIHSIISHDDSIENDFMDYIYSKSVDIFSSDTKYMNDKIRIIRDI